MFFDIFFDLCKKNGISCKKAAEDVGLSNSIRTKWKNTGATPGGDTLNRIAAYFGVSTDYLLGKKTEKASTENGERQMSDEELKFALWGDCTDVSDDDLDDVRRYAAFVRERKKDRK